MQMPSCPGRGAAQSGAPLIRDLYESGTIPGLQRTTTCCAAPGTSAHFDKI